MKITKKLFITLFAAVLSAGFISCGGADSPSGRSYIGTKVPSKAKEVGDIVFNDGSAMPYEKFETLSDEKKDEIKASAIAIIFSKGPETSDKRTTSRTLGVGLKHNQKGGIKWCSDTAAAYDYWFQSIRSYWNPNGGKINTEGDLDGHNNFEQIGTELGDNDDTDNAEKYPAFYYAINYALVDGSNILADTEFVDGWYIPTTEEFNQLYIFGVGRQRQFDINALSKALGGDVFYETYDNGELGYQYTYWTSNSVEKGTFDDYPKKVRTCSFAPKTDPNDPDIPNFSVENL